MSIVSVSAGKLTLREFFNLVTQKIKCLIVNEVYKGLIFSWIHYCNHLLTSQSTWWSWPVTLTTLMRRRKKQKRSMQDSSIECQCNWKWRWQLNYESRYWDAHWQHAPDLICPPPIKAELLKKADKSIRDMIRVVQVSASRSHADGCNILFIYPLQ